MIIHQNEAMQVPGSDELSMKVVKSKIIDYKTSFVPFTFVRQARKTIFCLLEYIFFLHHVGSSLFFPASLFN